MMASAKLLPVFLRSAYNYDREAASNESGIDFTGSEDMAKQSFAEECDINTIVRRFGLTGQLPDPVRAPTYGDFTQVYDFQTAMNAVAAARESFDALPAEVRYRFGNDPQRLLEFCADDSNLEEARKLGIVVSKAQEAAKAADAGSPGEPGSSTQPG